jgi:hypothetical protein
MRKRLGKRASAKRSVQRVQRITRWLERAGVRDSDTRATIAVDLSDALDAMDVIDGHLSAMLRTNPQTRDGNDHALTHVSGLGVWWSTELRFHVQRLHRHWEKDVEAVVARGPRKARNAAA